MNPIQKKKQLKTQTNKNHRQEYHFAQNNRKHKQEYDFVIQENNELSP